MTEAPRVIAAVRPDVATRDAALRDRDGLLLAAKTASTAEVLAAIRHAAVAASSFTAAGLPHALAWQTGEHDRSGLGLRETAPARGRYVRTRDRSARPTGRRRS